MNDKAIICYSDLTALTTASNGVINYKDGEFSLDRKKWTLTCYYIANAGANCVRLIPYGIWLCPSRQAIFTPFKHVGGQWDLSVWNPQYFVILKKVVDIATSYGLTVWFDLFDNCQKSSPQDSPHWNNIQGFNGFYDSRCDDISRNWILSVHDILKDAGAIYGCGNEMTWDGVDLCKRLIYPVLKELDIPADRIAYGTHYQLGEDYDSKTMEWMKRWAKDFWGEARNNILRPVHNILSPASISDSMPFGNYVYESLLSWGNSPLRIAFSDDGTWDGTSNCDYFNFNGHIQRRPDVNIWKAFSESTMRDYPTVVNGFPKFVYEHCPKSEDVAGCQAKTIRAISEAYKIIYGTYPSNFNKYPKPIFNKIGDTLEPVQPDKTNNWYLYATILLIIIMIILMVVL